MDLSRYAMTPIPEPGGQPGAHEEALAQWFLELAFFRDLVFRNPPGKGGKGELADGVVLHGDVALMAQVKAQSSPRPPHAWAKKAIIDALDQLRHTNRMIAEGHVRALRSELLGELPLDPTRYVNRWGLIVLDQPSDPFEPVALVPEIAEAPFPVQVFSLEDLRMLTERFDTAADFITYMEMRHGFRSRLNARVHDEAATLARILDHAPEYLRHFRPDAPTEMLDRSVEMIRRTCAGEFRQQPYLAYGQAYDDLIARLHEPDPDLPHNATMTPADALPIIEELSWLTRARRVALGQRIATMCDRAREIDPSFFAHFQRPRGIVFVYLATAMPRSARAELLQALTLRAQAKFACSAALGVATEPLGAGRSYDVCLHHGALDPAILDRLPASEDPFGGESAQLTDSI